MTTGLCECLRVTAFGPKSRFCFLSRYCIVFNFLGLSVVTLEKALEINRISAKVGDNVEIRCDVSGNPPPPIVWKRYSADLTTLGDEDVRVFSDGSLYLTKIQLVHAGNYTCRALRNSEVTQTHVLTVHSALPIIIIRVNGIKTYCSRTMFIIIIVYSDYDIEVFRLYNIYVCIAAVPEVKVTPRIQSRRPGEKTSMFCHVIGEPFPEVNASCLPAIKQ